MVRILEIKVLSSKWLSVTLHVSETDEKMKAGDALSSSCLCKSQFYFWGMDHLLQLPFAFWRRHQEIWPKRFQRYSRFIYSVQCQMHFNVQCPKFLGLMRCQESLTPQLLVARRSKYGTLQRWIFHFLELLQFPRSRMGSPLLEADLLLTFYQCIFSGRHNLGWKMEQKYPGKSQDAKKVWRRLTLDRNKHLNKCFFFGSFRTLIWFQLLNGSLLPPGALVASVAAGFMPGQNSNFGVQIQPKFCMIRAIVASVSSGHLEDLRESSGCTSGSQTKETGSVLKKALQRSASRERWCIPRCLKYRLRISDNLKRARAIGTDSSTMLEFP